MARVKLTEYKAKKILLGDTYAGVAIRDGEPFVLPTGTYVVKVDQGVKKRMKRGLVALNVDASDVGKHVAEWKKQGFTSFIAEPMRAHEATDERYLSFERVRGGIRVLYAREGGIEIEEHPEQVETRVLADADDAFAFAEAAGIPTTFIERVLAAFDTEHFAFLELNPILIEDGTVIPLDAAALVDSAAQFFVSAWSAADVVKSITKHPAEVAVETLAETTPASLKLNVIAPDGSLFFLLSGGGGSIVIADEAELLSMGKEIANYGEYSGGPTREETHLYTREVLELVLASKAEKKALVIAGGVANFTDVKSTFAGIIDAFKERADALREQNVRVYVRRGGPNEVAGLSMMRAFLEEEKLLGSVHGSEAVITEAVDDAITYLKS